MSDYVKKEFSVNIGFIDQIGSKMSFELLSYEFYISMKLPKGKRPSDVAYEIKAELDSSILINSSIEDKAQVTEALDVLGAARVYLRAKNITRADLLLDLVKRYLEINEIPYNGIGIQESF